MQICGDIYPIGFDYPVDTVELAHTCYAIFAGHHGLNYSIQSPSTISLVRSRLGPKALDPRQS